MPCAWLPALPSRPPRPRLPAPPGRAFLVRGIFTVFSLGLDMLARELSQKGFEVQVVPASLAAYRARALCEQYRKQPETPLIVIGHSLGGDLAPQVARILQAEKIPVRLMVILDATHPGTIPANVQRCVNYYYSTAVHAPLIQGRPVRADQPTTEIVNLDLASLPADDPARNVTHFTIDASNRIHQLVIADVTQACRTDRGAHVSLTSHGRDVPAGKASRSPP